MKACSVCGSSKDLSCFNKDRTCQDGHKSCCRDCEKARRRRSRPTWDKRRKAAAARRKRDWAYQNKYGISWDDAYQLLRDQDFKCQICKKRLTSRNRHLDHCHKTGKVAGWLCAKHNKALGAFADGHDIDLLIQLVQYALRTRHNQ